MIATTTILLTVSASLVTAQLPPGLDITTLATPPTCPASDAAKFTECISLNALSFVTKCNLTELVSGGKLTDEQTAALIFPKLPCVCPTVKGVVDGCAPLCPGSQLNPQLVATCASVLPPNNGTISATTATATTSSTAAPAKTTSGAVMNKVASWLLLASLTGAVVLFVGW
ncbi:hypothetical protein HDV05_008266 [Chytridiales sp. JEL 0842]|nr:hypothetical protein HDV05_008266 [Chytridiales sp. JEL 0842]